MGQGINNNVDNISLTGNSIHTYNKEKVSNDLDTSLSFQGNDSSSYIFEGEPSKNTKVNKTMDQFEEYLKTQQEKAKESGADAASEERAEKEAAEELRNHLTGDELKRLAMMGVDIESAKLSDLLGMINTMRGSAHREAMAEMFAEIKADSGDTDNLVVTGGGVKVAGTDVKVSDVSVTEVADNKADGKSSDAKSGGAESKSDAAEGFLLGRKELVYLIRNELTLDKASLYKAHFSGMRESANPLQDSAFEAMRAQLENIIEASGIEGFSMEDARFLLDNELPVNEDSMKLVAEYRDMEGKHVDELDIPQDEAELVDRVAREIYEKVSQISPDTVADMARQGKSVTIHSAYIYQMEINETAVTRQVTGKTADSKISATEAAHSENMTAPTAVSKKAAVEAANEITARRQMEEIRFAMTMEAAGRMARLDVNIDTRELSRVIDILRAAEQELIKDTLRKAGIEPTAENTDMLAETSARLDELKSADTKALTVAIRSESFTIRSVYAEAFSADAVDTGDLLSRRFEALKRSYEAVGTAPRSDMGDSISKAFSNIEELLGELNIPVDSETVRAAKILGYNSIEITQDNIDAVVNYDRQVNQLMDSFYPEAVMGLIKDGINPMDVPIDELNNIIADRNYNQGVTEAANFAIYLRDLEKQGEVTPEQRESYIGIYRIMDKLAKSGDREAGFVFANKANLTIRNMLSAMRSRRAKGIDVSIDDDFGILEDLNKYGKAIDEQIMAGFTAAEDGNTGDEESANELTADIERYRDLRQNIEEYIRENGIENNISNALAVDAILNNQGGLYELVSDVMSKLRFKDSSKEELIDEETGNMAQSLLDGEAAVEPVDELGMEKLLRELSETGDISLTYDDLRDRITEMMYQAGQTGSISSLDIAAIKTVNAGLNIMSHLARQDRYQIPVETHGGTAVINLTLKSAGAADGSQIDINAPTESLGNISAHMVIVADGNGIKHMTGSIVSDTQEGNQELQKMTDMSIKISDRMSGDADITDVNISMGTVDRQSISGESVSRGDACKAAVGLVRIIAELLR